MVNIIKRNSSIPARETKEFTTVEKGQDSILFQVYEGERVTAKENNLLGEFELPGNVFFFVLLVSSSSPFPPPLLPN